MGGEAFKRRLIHSVALILWLKITLYRRNKSSIANVLTVKPI